MAQSKSRTERRKCWSQDLLGIRREPTPLLTNTPLLERIERALPDPMDKAMAEAALQEARATYYHRAASAQLLLHRVAHALGGVDVSGSNSRDEVPSSFSGVGSTDASAQPASAAATNSAAANRLARGAHGALTRTLAGRGSAKSRPRASAPSNVYATRPVRRGR